MLKRPSSRRKSSTEQIELNLVPMLDTLVTLIGFLLFTMSFLTIVSIESPFPEVSSSKIHEQIKEKPLQLTLTLRENEAELWSPFDRITPKKIADLEPGKPNTAEIHRLLVEVKKQFPEETKIVLVPSGGVPYDVLVSVMDSLRGIDEGDEPIFHRNPATGNDEAVKALFPEVVFGNLLSDPSTNTVAQPVQTEGGN